MHHWLQHVPIKTLRRLCFFLLNPLNPVQTLKVLNLRNKINLNFFPFITRARVMTSAWSYHYIKRWVFLVEKNLHGLQRHRLIPFPLKSPCVTILQLRLIFWLLFFYFFILYQLFISESSAAAHTISKQLQFLWQPNCQPNCKNRRKWQSGQDREGYLRRTSSSSHEAPLVYVALTSKPVFGSQPTWPTCLWENKREARWNPATTIKRMTHSEAQIHKHHRWHISRA